MLEYCLVDDLPSLVWVANLGTIELHPLLARAEDVYRPTALAFDLDPGVPATIVDCCRVALQMRTILQDVGLRAFPKTTGGKGLHLYVPLNTPHSYEQTKSFARALAGVLAREYPDRIVDKMDKSLRRGKVLIDWSQNDPTKSTVVAYSLRAAPAPTVSTPVEWADVEHAAAAGDPRLLTFDAGDVLDRVERLGDLFAPVLELQQTLPG